jgi:hypothetical protein
MLKNEEYYRCRVCGLQQDDLPWGEDGETPSFNICPCCGTEFGYEDFTLEATRAQRERWLSTGAKWFKPKEKPEGWNLDEQLKKIPQHFL